MLPVRLYSRHHSKVIETLTKDLGVGGLRCLAPSAKAVSSPVSIEIALGPGEKSLSLGGRIAWVGLVPHSQQFYLGLAFHDLSAEDTTRLSRYLEKVFSSKTSS